MVYNRDFFVALFFLALSLFFFVASFSLPEPMFGQLASWTWPRLILIPLALLSLVLLVQSQQGAPLDVPPGRALRTWFVDNRRPFICFSLFFLFLLTMPVLGMLLGGLIYVFLTLSVLGGWQPRQLALHAAIACVFVVGMWSIFTLGLGVLLPQGTILRAF